MIKQPTLNSKINEEIAKIKCEICGKEFEKITITHLKTHGITFDEYMERFPDALLVSEGYRRKLLGEKNHFYGKHHTKEVKQKMSDAHLGKPSPMKDRHHTEATKQKMSDNHADVSGKNNPNYGVEPWNKGETKETNIKVKEYGEKQSKTKKEFFASEKGQEWVKKHMCGENAFMHGKGYLIAGERNGMYRRHHTEEAKQNMSNSHIGNTGEKNGMYGKHHTKEAKQRISDNQPDKSGKNNPMYGKGYLITGEKNHFYGKHHTEESLRKMLKAVCAKPNKPEQYLLQLLQEILPNEYKFVGDGSVIIGGCSPDFINTNGQKKFIEMFGDYWHRNDDEGNRIFQFKLFGFETLVVWEHELRDDEIEMTIAKIMEFHFRDKEK